MNIAPAGTRAFTLAENIPATGSWVVLDGRTPAGAAITDDMIYVGPADQQTAASHALWWNELEESKGRAARFWVTRPYPEG